MTLASYVRVYSAKVTALRQPGRLVPLKTWIKCSVEKRTRFLCAKGIKAMREHVRVSAELQAVLRQALSAAVCPKRAVPRQHHHNLKASLDVTAQYLPPSRPTPPSFSLLSPSRSPFRSLISIPSEGGPPWASSDQRLLAFSSP